jgi:hypothetical protein
MRSSPSLRRLLPVLCLLLIGAEMIFSLRHLSVAEAEQEPNQCVLPSCASFCKTDGGVQSCVRLCGSFPYAVTPWDELCPSPSRLASFECSFFPTSCTYTCAGA